MLGVLVLFVLCQQPMDPVRAGQAAEMIARARGAAESGHAKDTNRQAQRDFAERFNRLVRALKDFEEAYSHNSGQVWPVKQAAKLDIAMRELSSSPGWRRPD